MLTWIESEPRKTRSRNVDAAGGSGAANGLESDGGLDGAVSDGDETFFLACPPNGKKLDDESDMRSRERSGGGQPPDTLLSALDAHPDNTPRMDPDSPVRPATPDLPSPPLPIPPHTTRLPPTPAELQSIIRAASLPRPKPTPEKRDEKCWTWSHQTNARRCVPR